MQSYSVFGPSNNDLSEEYILWSFNTQNNTLSIVNYYTTAMFGFSTGEYQFTYTEDEILIRLNNSNIGRYDYHFENNTLIISDNPAADGPLITFIPKEQDCINNPFENLQWLHDIKITLEQTMNPTGSQIIQYVYNNECFYTVNVCYSCSDELVQVYNIAGEITCEFGGILGLNTCPDFYENAVFKRYLFNNVE